MSDTGKYYVCCTSNATDFEKTKLKNNSQAQFFFFWGGGGRGWKLRMLVQQNSDCFLFHLGGSYHSSSSVLFS